MNGKLFLENASEIIYIYIYIYIYISKSKVGDFSRGRPEGSLCNSYNRGGDYSFLWIAPLHPRYVPYIAEC